MSKIRVERSYLDTGQLDDVGNKYAVMLDLGEIFCGEKSGSGFCREMGGVECPGNE